MHIVMQTVLYSGNTHACTHSVPGLWLAKPWMCTLSLAISDAVGMSIAICVSFVAYLEVIYYILIGTMLVWIPVYDKPKS